MVTIMLRSSRTVWRISPAAVPTVRATPLMPARSASPAAAAREKALPASDCTTPSWRSAAMWRRSTAPASMARLRSRFSCSRPL